MPKQIQRDLDKTARDDGIKKFRTNNRKQQEKGRASFTKAGNFLLASDRVDAFIASIQSWLDTYSSARVGRRVGAYPQLKLIGAEVSARIAAQEIIDQICNEQKLTAATQAVGARIEDAFRYAWVKKEHGPLLRTIESRFTHLTGARHRRTVLMVAMRNAGLSLKDETEWKGEKSALVIWSNNVRTAVGGLMIEHFRESTGLIETPLKRQGKKTEYFLQATPEALQWIRDYNAHAEGREVEWLPMVEEPEPWDSPYEGGYSAEFLPSLRILKNASKAHLRSLATTAYMHDVYGAVNLLQSTPWRVNTEVLAVAKEMAAGSGDLGGLLAEKDELIPNSTPDVSTNAVALAIWRKTVEGIKTRNALRKSARLEQETIFSLADKFANEPQIYFPHQLDFRGRAYPLPGYLQPQGRDLCRGLLRFAKGVVISDEEGAFWLKIHGANLYGIDKTSIEERTAWVDGNSLLIHSIADDPKGNRSAWQDLEKPWQFLAWCFEWSAWLKTGQGFVTHLPVHVDGSNNGLQILSLLMRDEKIAQDTNVLPNDAPADLYASVAEETRRLLEEAVKGEKADFAAQFLHLKIDRKTTKRPVMTLPYGVRLHTMKGHCLEWYRTQLATAIPPQTLPPDAEQRAWFLAELMHTAMKSIIKKPMEAMEWLRECAKIMTDAGLPLQWEAPSGLPVLQQYVEQKPHRVYLSSNGKERSMSLRVDREDGKLDKEEQMNGISPNFVHSLDGAAMVETALNMKRYVQGCSFSAIHDAYATHSPHMWHLQGGLKLAFERIFREDQLGKLRNQLQHDLKRARSAVELPPVPPFGTLNVGDLHKSKYFFA